MILHIDTSDAEKIIVGLDNKKFTTQSRKDKSQKLLLFIDELLKKEGFGHHDISEIKVSTGPGSFTGLRVGVSVANALGWSLGISVNGRRVEKGFVEIKYE